MQTQEFETKTIFLNRNHAKFGSMWPIALDIGYSAVKGMSPNGAWCFPSFARRIGKVLEMGEIDPDTIQYRSGGETWSVGSTAQLSINTSDTNDTLETLYGRNRYYSPMFLVLARTGVALGMSQGPNGDPSGSKPCLQTGLPPAYIKSDSQMLREVLASRHEFELRMGDGPWRRFDFTLSGTDVRIMSQPMGSLLSAAMADDCSQLQGTADLLASNVLIFDAGFGTLDVFSMRHRELEPAQSFNDLGMKAVLMDVSEEIFRRYRAEIPVPAMQKCLHNGFVQVFNRKELSTKNVEFANILEASSRKTCEKALKRIRSMYSDLIDYEYLLVTGGTGAAWEAQIRDTFKGMTNLKIISGQGNAGLPHVFSNVRGYYLYQASMLKKQLGW